MYNRAMGLIVGGLLTCESGHHATKRACDKMEQVSRAANVVCRNNRACNEAAGFIVNQTMLCDGPGGPGACPHLKMIRTKELVCSSGTGPERADGWGSCTDVRVIHASLLKCSGGSCTGGKSGTARTDELECTFGACSKLRV